MNIIDKIKEYVKKRHEFVCDNCKKTFDKKELIEVHSNFITFGPNVESEKNFCKDCFYEHIQEKIRSFNSEAVFFYPVSGLEYNFFPLDVAKVFIQDEELSKKFIKQINSIMPHDGDICCRCNSKPAQITWCPDEVNSEYWTIDDKALESAHIEKMCPECFAEAIIEYMKEDKTMGITMFDMIDRDGFCVPGDI